MFFRQTQGRNGCDLSSALGNFMGNFFIRARACSKDGGTPPTPLCRTGTPRDTQADLGTLPAKLSAGLVLRGSEGSFQLALHIFILV